MSTPLEEKAVKNDLYEIIVNTRRIVLTKLADAVRDAKFDYTSETLAARDKYYAMMGLAGNVLSVIGTVAGVVPVVGSIPGAVIGAIGGGVSTYASYEKDLNKPDFSPTDEMIESMKGAIIASINNAMDASRYAFAINKVKEDLYKQYGHDPKYGPGLHQLDRKQLREALVWKTLYRELDPATAESQAYTRMKRAIVSLFKAVVQAYPDYVDAVNRMAVKSVPNQIHGHGGVVISSGTVDVADPATRAKYMTFEKFNAWFRATSHFAKWKSENGAIKMPGM